MCMFLHVTDVVATAEVRLCFCCVLVGAGAARLRCGGSHPWTLDPHPTAIMMAGGRDAWLVVTSCTTSASCNSSIVRLQLWLRESNVACVYISGLPQSQHPPPPPQHHRTTGSTGSECGGGTWHRACGTSACKLPAAPGCPALLVCGIPGSARLNPQANKPPHWVAAGHTARTLAAHNPTTSR